MRRIATSMFMLFSISLSVTNAVAAGKTIVTVVGGGAGDGELATAAILYNPRSVDRMPDGRILVADTYHHRIRTIDQEGRIATIVGNGTAGWPEDGIRATESRLYRPYAARSDLDGNVFIADTFNGRIRKVSVDGIIQTVAGGQCRYCPIGDGGPATSASLSYPIDVAIDTDGSLYIAEVGRGRIRKVDPTGVIQTVAGGGSSSADGVPALEAQVSALRLQIDGGRLLFADGESNRVRYLENGTIYTLAGGGGSCPTCYGFGGDGGSATSAVLNFPADISKASDGTLYIADVGNHRIRAVNSDGIIRTYAGDGYIAAYGNGRFGGDGGSATQASLSFPYGVLAEAGDVLIADTSNHRIRKVDSSGIISTVAGSGETNFFGDNGDATKAALSRPSNVVVDSHGNTIFTDTENNRVRMVTSGGVISTIAGTGAWEYFGDGGLAIAASFRSPQGLAIDAQDNLYVADTYNERIRKITPGGRIETVAGLGNDGPGGHWTALANLVVPGDGLPALAIPLNYPEDVAVGPTGDLYIAATNSNRVFRVDHITGLAFRVAGRADLIGSSAGGDGGPAISATVPYPHAVAVAANGDVYIADGNSRIRKVIASSGVIITWAGGGNFCWCADGDGGPANAASLYAPRDLAFTPQGDLLIADSGNNRIRKVTKDRIITTVAGSGWRGFSGDGGDPTNAVLWSPLGIYAAADGSWLIADTFNDRIRKVI